MADGGKRTDTRKAGGRWARGRWRAVAGPELGGAVLTAVLALYMTVVTFGNLTDFDTNQQFVRHVLAMDTTFGDPDLVWRAIGSSALQDGAYVGIIAWEVMTSAVLLRAAWLWGRGLWGAQPTDPGADPAADGGSDRGGDFARARDASTAGLVMVLLLFGLGFLVVGGEWFAMWQSEKWNGLDAAGRSAGLAAVALVLVHLPAAPRRPAR